MVIFHNNIKKNQKQKKSINQTTTHHIDYDNYLYPIRLKKKKKIIKLMDNNF